MIGKKVFIPFFLFWFVPLYSHGAMLHPVPFTSQAPFGSWQAPYQDFCEEASIVMAAHFVWGVSISPEIADLEMRIIERYEKLLLGRSKDTSAEETATILRNLYGFKNVSVKGLVGVQTIKKELDLGRVVIVPAAGRMLKNPYFTPPGPLYHMLVITGYDDAAKIFTTNDPGTRRGNSLSYNQTILYNAVHDWNNGDVSNGRKVMITIGK